MTQHSHAVFDPTCFRCDLSAAEEPPMPEPVESESERDLAMLKRQLALKERELQRLLVIEQRQGVVDDAARAFVEWHLKGQPGTPGTLYPFTYAQQEAWHIEWDKRLTALIEAGQAAETAPAQAKEGH